ncbi:aminoacyl-tRNA hydrolase [Flavobacteriaceae bacterium S0825]|uniref:aminoacyl-tRNA hydrolase n=1 Tax=Gaetbulibacter sp. S0825 TaxID=2720084 RepID=UPI00143092E6|nr:aminoacyl-tRNA hydrolase [Gaetbulibacter sp. S0825]MCK0107753.1 aminoacyl-tRNA hydrolase [Flavobacteriaceae bacterium S0825]NIX63389.1 aminoacyl-tRNA hydrolase [Gaetbulibacter sp. S0825]
MCNFFNWIFGQKKQSFKEDETIMKKYLIVGLGNIGEKYQNTRHNIGFKILDFFASKETLVFETVKLADRANYKLKGRSFIFLKPNTYMNLSGKAVKYWLEKEKIPLENLLIITDDLNLPFGTLRLKTKGSDGGHNGLKDIQEKLNTTKYNRFRFGISDDFGKGRQVDYVLGEWTAEENEKLEERLNKSVEVIKSFGLSGMNNTMNGFNGK